MSQKTNATSVVSVCLKPPELTGMDEASDQTERQSPSDIFWNINESNKKLKQKKRAPQKLMSLFKNERLWSRILILFIIIFLWLLCIVYTLSQILQLTLTNYLCQNKTKSEQSYSDNDCRRAKRFMVNEAALWSNASYGADLDLSVTAICKCFSFFTLCVLFTICIIQSIIMLVTDVLKYRKYKLGKWHYEKQLKKQQKNSKLKRVKWCAFITDPLRKLYNWQRRNFEVDSGKWIIFSMFRELFEVILQSQALLLYNGINVLDLKNVFLANEPRFIELFAIFIFLNCIASGVLWTFYAFKPGSQYCHGLMFEYILYSSDALFDCFYTLFPLIIVLSTTQSSAFTIALASLQTDTQIAFWATFLPLVFLCIKFWTLSSKSAISHRRHYAKIYVQSIIEVAIDEQTVGDNISDPTTIITDFTTVMSEQRPTLSTAQVELQKIFHLVLNEYTAHKTDEEKQTVQNTKAELNIAIDVNEEMMVYLDYKTNTPTLTIPNNRSFSQNKLVLRTPVFEKIRSGSVSLEIDNIYEGCDIEPEPMPMNSTPKISLQTHKSLPVTKTNLSPFNPHTHARRKTTHLTAITVPLQNRFSTTSWMLEDTKPKPNNLQRKSTKSQKRNSTVTVIDPKVEEENEKGIVTENVNDIRDSMMKELQRKWSTRYTKKMIFVFISFVFFIYGSYLLYMVLSHFTNANIYCNSLVDLRVSNNTSFSQSEMDLLEQNSEIFLFDFCEFPVFPFTFINSDICQCRNFRILFDENWSLKADDIYKYFGVNIVHVLMNVFKHGYMLEKVQMKNVKILYSNGAHTPLFNFTNEMFVSQRLRVFEFSQMPTYYIDDAISEWEELVYFSFTENNILRLPKTFSKLSSLTYLEWGKDVNIKEFPTQICHLKNLKGLRLSVNSFKSVPFCLVNLPSLRSLMLHDSMFEYSQIPLGLFNMPQLNELTLYNSNINMDELMVYNNMSNIQEFDADFRYNNVSLTKYQMSFTNICAETRSQELITFIELSGACERYCETGEAYAECPPYIWNDGVCDYECNTEVCNFDGSDCD